ncbi:hypothetical protein ERJ75_000415300 [Trypanosoma vivax]|nr:hypothetical protein ERJ75_000415300 [Trypanosoma vivax]
MFAVAFVLFLLGNGCVSCVCGQQEAAGSHKGPDYFACGGENWGDSPTPLGKCDVTKDSGDKLNINCSRTNDPGSTNLTNCTSTGDSEVIYMGCNGTLPRQPDTPGPFYIFVSSCFVNRYTHDVKKCGSVDPGQPHSRPKNCTEVLSEYEKRKPAPTNNSNAVTREDKKESPKQKQNDSPATRQQRSEVNVTEQNRPTSVERNESKEVTTPHTSTSSGTVLLMGLHARVFCALQLLRLLK